MMENENDPSNYYSEIERRFIMLQQSIGIDLGTANTLIYKSNQGLIFNEPTVIAVDKKSNKVIAVGHAAKEMLGRTNPNVVALRPVVKGVISNYDFTERLLKHCILNYGGKRLFGIDITICVPSQVTEIEKRSIEEVSYRLGAKHVHILDEPIAAAVGCGIDIDAPMGNMLIDIGGGTTDIAIICLGGIVHSASIKLAGDDFDDAIIKHLWDVHQISIGALTAEQIKITLGSFAPTPKDATMTLRGLHIVRGVPETITLTGEEIHRVLKPLAETLMEQIHHVLEQTPPELVADIYDTGIMLTGGGSMLPGTDELIAHTTGLTVHRSDDPLSSVGRGLQAKLNGRIIKSKGDIQR